jgi:hypothetical protein
MRILAALALVSGGLLGAAMASAHHSPAMLFDLSREISVSGVVTEYELGNPHLRIYFDVDNAGTIEKWMAEGGSRTVLLRKGWDGSEFAPGDRVTMRGHPTRDGSRVVHLQYVTLPDGSERFAEDLNSEALDERRRRD